MDKYSRIKILVASDSNKDILQMFIKASSEKDYKNPPTVMQSPR